jgi:signal transduction histidine kinase
LDPPSAGVDAPSQRLDETVHVASVPLAGAARMKSELLVNMSHELRTPLNAIIGFSEVLRDGLIGDLTDQQRKFVGDIFDSGRHLLSLINDMLELSRVDTGVMTLCLAPVDVPSLLASSLSFIREDAANRNVRVRMLPSSPPLATQVTLDVARVKHIVYQLLSNAVRFTGAGGSVSIGANRVPLADVGRRFGWWPAHAFPTVDHMFAEFLEVSVVDTGIGIRPEMLAHLFVPFDEGQGRMPDGAQPGLALVKRLVDLHGGAVAVESAFGEGSRFTVWLPLRGVAAWVPAVAPAARPLTALVVDDDLQAANLIRLHLDADGFEVLHAASAEIALAYVAERRFSLITIDVLLPDMDGWSLLGRLTGTAALRSTPVVMISIVADRARGLAAGAAAVIQKPVSRHELRQSLAAIGLVPLPPPAPPAVSDR